jgi:hypothetical protein
MGHQQTVLERNNRAPQDGSGTRRASKARAQGTDPPATASTAKAQPAAHAANGPRAISRTGLVVGIFLVTLFVGLIVGSIVYNLIDQTSSELTTNEDFTTLADLIINAESNGNPRDKNKKSSATGPAQFLDDTWLEMIAAYRPTLAAGHNQKEILALRRDPGLAREMTTRFMQRNAKILRKRNLPVTPGTLYLTHFAGIAGAIAILSEPDTEHAATIMAKADVSGHLTRAKIVAANPFLAEFTVADLKHWADAKMQNSGH